MYFLGNLLLWVMATLCYNEYVADVTEIENEIKSWKVIDLKGWFPCTSWFWFIDSLYTLCWSSHLTHITLYEAVWNLQRNYYYNTWIKLILCRKKCWLCLRASENPSHGIIFLQPQNHVPPISRNQWFGHRSWNY